MSLFHPETSCNTQLPLLSRCVYLALSAQEGKVVVVVCTHRAPLSRLSLLLLHERLRIDRDTFPLFKHLERLLCVHHPFIVVTDSSYLTGLEVFITV